MESDPLVRKLAAIIVVAVLSLSQSFAQNAPASPNSDRRVIARVAPSYPDLARKMHLQGTVRIEAVVRANGVVKSARVLGGNPVLVDAASDAVKRWKFEPGPNETTQVVQLTFESQ